MISWKHLFDLYDQESKDTTVYYEGLVSQAKSQKVEEVKQREEQVKILEEQVANFKDEMLRFKKKYK